MFLYTFRIKVQNVHWVHQSFFTELQLPGAAGNKADEIEDCPTNQNNETKDTKTLCRAKNNVNTPVTRLNVGIVHF